MRLIYWFLRVYKLRPRCGFNVAAVGVSSTVTVCEYVGQRRWDNTQYHFKKVIRPFMCLCVRARVCARGVRGFLRLVLKYPVMNR